MKVVLVDTNGLMAIGQFGIDIFSEIERVIDDKHEIKILEGTITELEKIITEQKGKFKDRAKLALAIVKAKKIKQVKTQAGLVDDLLVELSRKGALVLTQDLGLKRRLTKPYLTIRQKKKVVLVQ